MIRCQERMRIWVCQGQVYISSVMLCRYSQFCEVKCNFFSIITYHIRIQELQHTFLCVVSLLVHHLIWQDSHTSISPEGTNRDMKQLCQHQNNLGVHIFKEFPSHYYNIWHKFAWFKQIYYLCTNKGVVWRNGVQNLETRTVLALASGKAERPNHYLDFGKRPNIRKAGYHEDGDNLLFLLA